MSEPLVLGRYRVVRRLAKGGMGVVYLGRLEGGAGFSKPVIIKRILPELDDRQDNTARFIREAQILSHLQHPCIVGVLDFGQEAGGYAMVLEYMHGYDLGRWLKYLQLTSTRMPWEEAVLIALRALDGLHYAHTFRRSDGTPAGVLHRDISPGNVLLDLEGQVRLLDFGIARALQEDASQYKTQDGILSGKIGYLAPELFSASQSSISSDIYACAVLLYLMLTGVHPFSAESESHTVWRVLHEMPAPLASVRSDLPLELEATLFRSLAKQPDLRHRTAEHFAQELRRLLIRDESAILCGLRQRLRHDFTGEMPGLLKIEPLAERDQAWRAAVDPDASVTPLRSSRLPPAPNNEATVAIPRLATAAPALTAAGPGAPPAQVVSLAAPERAGRAVAKSRLAVGIGLAVLIGGGGLVSWRQHEPAPAPGRLIVVESPAPRAPGMVSAAAQTGLAASPPAPTAPGAGDSSTIARQLARRQAALQSCFQEFSKDRAAPVQTTLRLDVAASGRVTAATLEPPSLEGTSVGQCLLRVAKETQFGELPSPIQFSVPLHARAVSK